MNAFAQPFLPLFMHSLTITYLRLLLAASPRLPVASAVLRDSPFVCTAVPYPLSRLPVRARLCLSVFPFALLADFRTTPCTVPHRDWDREKASPGGTTHTKGLST